MQGTFPPLQTRCLITRLIVSILFVRVVFMYISQWNARNFSSIPDKLSDNQIQARKEAVMRRADRVVKTSSLSDDEPLYDSVASDEDYSSIGDNQSIKEDKKEKRGEVRRTDCCQGAGQFGIMQVGNLQPCIYSIIRVIRISTFNKKEKRGEVRGTDCCDRLFIMQITVEYLGNLSEWIIVPNFSGWGQFGTTKVGNVPYIYSVIPVIRILTFNIGFLN